MQDFGSGDTSSNLVGGILIKSENRILGFFSHALSLMVYMSTPASAHSEIFATIKPEYSNHAIASGLASGSRVANTCHGIDNQNDNRIDNPLMPSRTA
jgi:hypothetical protein